MSTAVKTEQPSKETTTRNEVGKSTRQNNILAGKAIADAIRASLGPRGMDKMILNKNDVIITNDGATILKEMKVTHPAAKMLVEMSRSQDTEVGDGTTSVVLIAGSLLGAAEQLLNRGLHPQTISEAFRLASDKAVEILQNMSIPVDIHDHSSLCMAATTALNSKVVSQNSSMLAPMAVDAVLKVIDRDIDTVSNVDLKNIRIVKKVCGTVEDTEIVDGLVFTDKKVSRVAGGPTKVTNAKIGLIQFCLSLPKTDMENSITISSYQAIDRLLREERQIAARIVKTIAKTGCNVLMIQKSILRDAVSDIVLDYLAKMKILVVRDIERDDVEFICQTLNCQPIASIDHFTEDRLGSAELVADEFLTDGSRITKIKGVPGKHTLSILVRASNNLMLDEIERSMRDALCVVRSLIVKRALLPGGGAPETEVSQKLYEWSKTLEGSASLCVRAYAEALEVIPYTLAENGGLKPIEIVSELRDCHAAGKSNSGINVKHGVISDMKEINVVQPLLCSLSAIQLATETVTVILKIDDLVLTR